MGKLNFLWQSMKLAFYARDFSVFQIGLAYCIGGFSFDEYMKKMEDKRKLWLDMQTKLLEKKWDGAK